MCSQSPDEESYEFFEKIEKYIEKAKSAESSAALPDYESKCISFMNSSGSFFKDKETAKIICEEFIKLYYSLLNDLQCISQGDTDYGKCSKFLKYWVSFKLRKNIKNEVQCVSNIYNSLESQITGIGDFNISLDFRYDINKDDLYKMNILYSLYKKYKDIDGILENRIEGNKNLLLSLSSAGCTDYLEANYMCNGGNDDNISRSPFCMQLEKFKTKYKELYNRVEEQGPEYSKYFKRLSQCDNNTMSTALIGTTVGLVPLLVGLYKFTPLRQLINFKKGKLTEEYSNNDDQMRNIMLMDQQSEQTSSQQGIYNIKYHSV